MISQLHRHSQYVHAHMHQYSAACLRGIVQRRPQSVRKSTSAHGQSAARLVVCSAAHQQDWDANSFLQLLKDRQTGEPSAKENYLLQFVRHDLDAHAWYLEHTKRYLGSSNASYHSLQGWRL